MKPIIDKTSFIHPSAVILGNVKIGKNCGVFPHAVIRGDKNLISIDDGSNVQDCCVIHTDKDHKVKIGKNVSIGHCAMVHGAIIKDDCLIGINATILNNAVIGKGSIIGANALVKEGERIPENSLVVGIPGKIIKQDEKFRKQAQENAKTYRKISKEHKDGKYLSFISND